MADRTVTLNIRDYGPWNPDDPAAAAVLIAVVNEHRRPDDDKPAVRAWNRQRCLSVQLNGEHFTLDPGERLCRVTGPTGVAMWGTLPEGEQRLFGVTA